MKAANLHPRADRTVPLVGLSFATALFRSLATTNATEGKSVLLLGPPGVGKSLLARVWQFLYDGAPLPIIDLDAAPSRPVPKEACIAFSARPLPGDIPALHLGTGKRDFVTYSSEPSEATILDEAIADRFPLRLFMPPLVERPADILCLLQFFNRFVLPRQLSCTYESISAPLVEQMLDIDWPGNAHDLLDCLTTAAERDLRATKRAGVDTLVNLGNLHTVVDQEQFNAREAAPAVRSGWQQSRTAVAAFVSAPSTRQQRKRRCSETDAPIPFNGLPKSAVGSYVRELLSALGPYLKELPIPATSDEYIHAFIDTFIAGPINAYDSRESSTPIDEETATVVEILETNPQFGTTLFSLCEGLNVDWEQAAALRDRHERQDQRASAVGNKSGAAQLSINRWSQLAVGIYETGKHGIEYYAFTPPPDPNEVEFLKRGIKLEFAGERWPEVLKCFAKSEDGRTATNADLIAALNFDIPPPSGTLDDDERNEQKRRLRKEQVHEEKLRIVDLASKRLRNAIYDLARQLRSKVRCGESGPFEVKDSVAYRSRVTIGFIKDDDGKLQFTHRN